jgi:hypothetical protein
MIFRYNRNTMQATQRHLGSPMSKTLFAFLAGTSSMCLLQRRYNIVSTKLQTSRLIVYRLRYLGGSSFCFAAHPHAVEGQDQWAKKACSCGHPFLGIIVCSMPILHFSKYVLINRHPSTTSACMVKVWYPTSYGQYNDFL